MLKYVGCPLNLPSKIQNDFETFLSHQLEAIIMFSDAWVWTRLIWDLPSIWCLKLLSTGGIAFTLTEFQQCLYLLPRNFDYYRLFLWGGLVFLFMIFVYFNLYTFYLHEIANSLLAEII